MKGGDENMWFKINLKEQLFEAGIDASTLWVLVRLLMLAGVLSASNSMIVF